MDNLTHWVRTLQDANVPLVQLQDPMQTRGTGLLVVTDEQRIDLWSAANREHYRLQRGTLMDRWYGKAAVVLGMVAGLLGAVSSLMVITGHVHP